ncbi:MAG: FtsQ-type POTRA domain-containing protein [Kiritimatiellae bacterium]|nr:FtsQ-type POTRA domain-containing protein [Kiritimatiellia bacterium]
MGWWIFSGSGRNRRREKVRRRDRVQYVRSTARVRGKRSSGAGSSWARSALALAGVGALFVAAVFLSLLILRQSTRLALTRNIRFTVQTLDVASDGKITPELIREYAGVREGENLFAVNLQQVRNNLMEVPLVREARVQRVLPGTLRIRVVERTAVARIPVQRGSAHHGVDREGFVLGPRVASPHLPRILGLDSATVTPGRRIEGVNARDALELIELCDRLDPAQDIGLQSVDTSRPDILMLTLDHDDTAHLGRSRLDLRVAWLAAMRKAIEMEQRRGTRPLFFDVRGERNHAVTGLKDP